MRLQLRNPLHQLRAAGTALFVGCTFIFSIVNAADAADQPQCEREGYVTNATASGALVSGSKKSGRISVEHGSFVPMSADVAGFRVGHKVTLGVSGKIDVNRRYWEERKCKYFGLKCWYEPREASNWQNINARSIEYQICPDGIEKNSCKSPKSIKSSGQLLNDDWKDELNITATNSSTVPLMHKKYEFRGFVYGNDINRARCTGARPSTCSDGTYSVEFSVDVLPRLKKIQSLLMKRQVADEIVHPDFIDSFMEAQPNARKAAACLIFKHAQEFYPATGGSRLSRSRETLVRRAIKLEPHLEFRLALSSLMIANGRIDEAKVDIKKNLASAAEAYAKDKSNPDNAANYANALKNAATIWVKDRVGNEGADLEIAVSFLDKMVRVRRDILLTNRSNQSLLLEFVRSQQHRARIMTMIRSRTMLDAAEKSLSTALNWTPKRENAEITGTNHRLGEFVAYLPGQLPMPLIVPLRSDASDVSALPDHEQQIGLSVVRMPSWTARVTRLPGSAHDDPVFLYRDDTLARHEGARGKKWTEPKIWRPAVRGAAEPTWRYLKDCKDPYLEYLGGHVVPGNLSVSVAAIAKGEDAVLFVSKDKCKELPKAPKNIDGNHLVVLENGTVIALDSVADSKLYVMKLDGTSNDFEVKTIEDQKNKLLTIASIPSIERIVPLNGTEQVLLVGPVTESEPTKYVLLTPSETGYTASINQADAGTRLISATGDHVLVQNSAVAGLRTLDKDGKLGADLLHGFPLNENEAGCAIDGRIFTGNAFAAMTFNECKGVAATQASRLTLFDPKRGRYQATLPDAVSVTASGYTVFRAKDQDVYRISVIAAAAPGRIWRHDGANGARLSDAFAHPALTSANHQILPMTRAIVSTGLVYVKKKGNRINLPLFNGSAPSGVPDDASKILGFCSLSDWGCEIAPFFAQTPSPDETCRGAGEDTVLLVARGGVGEDDKFGRVKIACSSSGQLTFGTVVRVDEGDGWAAIDLVGPAGQKRESHWRLIDDALVAPERVTHVAMRVPVDPPQAGKALEYDVPVATVGPSDAVVVEHVNKLFLSGDVRAAAAIRSAGAAKFAPGQVAVAIVTPGGMTVYRNGVSSEAGDTIAAKQDVLLDVQVAAQDTGLLIGHLNPLNGSALIRRIAYVGGSFKVGTVKLNATSESLVREWTAAKRLSRSTPFKFFGATDDLSKGWVVNSGCGRVYDLGAGTQVEGREWVSGRPGSLKFLFDLATPSKDMTPGIVIERTAAEVTAASDLSPGVGYLEFWNNVPDVSAGADQGSKSAGNCVVSVN